MADHDIDFFGKKAYKAIKDAEALCLDWEHQLEDEMEDALDGLDTREAKEIDREQCRAQYYQEKLKSIKELMISSFDLDSEE